MPFFRLDLVRVLVACSLGVATVLFVPNHVRAEDEWPQLRGPAGDGHSSAKGVPLTWSEEENVTWKVEVPGRGWSSPVVSGNMIWLTTSHENEWTDEERERVLEEKGAKVKLHHVAKSVSFHALCFDRRDGKLLHDVKLRDLDDPPSIHKMNTYATPSPILREGRLYCHFGTMGTYAVDTTTAKVVWRREDIVWEHMTGPGASPVLLDGRLIFPCDGMYSQDIVALDAETGETVWYKKRSGEQNKNADFRRAFCTPLVLTEGGRTQLVSPGASWVYSYDPADGRELWKAKYPRGGFSIVPRPVHYDGRVIFFTGFVKSELLTFAYDGEGDVTESHAGWVYRGNCPRRSSPILLDDAFYFVADGGVVTCLDASDGSMRWRDRLDGNYSASPLLVEGRLYFFSEEGKVTVLQPGDEFEEIADSQLDGAFLATPAAIGREFYLRTDSHLYRVETKRVASR